MSPLTPVKLGLSTALREKRLAALLAGRDPADPALAQALVEAQAQGSLELAGLAGTPREAEERAALVRAARAVDPGAALGPEALLDWHAALSGERVFRATARARDEGPAPAPPEFIASRL